MALPRGSNRGMVAPMLPQAPVKINCEVDWASVAARNASEDHKCLHPRMNLDNEHPEQAYLAHPGDIAFTRVSFASESGRVTPGTRSAKMHRANGMNEVIQVPVDTTVNAMVADSPEELEDEIVPFGFVEDPGNRDNGSERFNTYSAGAIQRPNDDTYAVAAGDYGIVCVPGIANDDKGRAHVPSNARISNQVGGAGNRLLGRLVGVTDARGGTTPYGRVGLVLHKFTPEMVNVYDLKTYRSIVKDVVVTGGKSRGQVMRESKNLRVGYARAFVQMVRAAMYIGDTLGFTALDPDTLQNKGKPYNDALERNLIAFIGEVENGAAAAVFNTKVLDVANQEMMHHHARLSLRIHRRVLGRWIVGANSGDDAVFQIQNYSY